MHGVLNAVREMIMNETKSSAAVKDQEFPWNLPLEAVGSSSQSRCGLIYHSATQ